MRTPRHVGARAVAMALSGAALLVAAAGCGGGSSGDPTAGMSADQIYSQALDNLKAASSVHVAGSIVAGYGGPMNMNLTDGPGGCTGTLSANKAGTLGLLGIGSKLWIKPDRLFLTTSGEKAAVTNILTGKYVATTDKSANLATLCGLTALTSRVGAGSSLTKGPESTIAGQHVIQIQAPNSPGSAYVTVSSSPQIVRVDTGAGVLNFTNYNAPLTLNPPPASQVVDGSKYGF